MCIFVCVHVLVLVELHIEEILNEVNELHKGLFSGLIYC